MVISTKDELVHKATNIDADVEISFGDGGVVLEAVGINESEILVDLDMNLPG